MGKIRDFLNDPGRAAVSGPTHQDIWAREDARFDREAKFIGEQNAANRNHELALGAQLQGHSMNTMRHMDSTSSVGEFHANGMVSRYVPGSANTPGSTMSEAAPKPVAESRTGAAQAGVSDVARDSGVKTGVQVTQPQKQGRVPVKKDRGGKRANARAANFGALPTS